MKIMEKFEPTKSRSQFDKDKEGWLVQVYGGDRRLICIIEPSHAWAFLLGCGIGILFTVAWVNLASFSSSRTYAPATTVPELRLE